MLAAKRRYDEAAPPIQELLGVRAQLSHELSTCAAASRGPALDDSELVAAPPLEPGGPVPDERQLRLRRRAAELRTRRELHAQIAVLRAAVAAARERRARLLEADEAARPELAKLLVVSSSFDAYLRVPAAPGAAEPADPRARDLAAPLWALHTQASLLLGTPALGSTLFAVAVVPSADGGAPEPAAGAGAGAVAAPAPLAVRLNVLCARRQVSLLFTYHPKLHLVAVGAPGGGAELLRHVDPADDGGTLPHCRALLAASRGARACAVGGRSVGPGGGPALPAAHAFTLAP